jgi:hypothetical protein
LPCLPFSGLGCDHPHREDDWVANVCLSAPVTTYRGCCW